MTELNKEDIRTRDQYWTNKTTIKTEEYGLRHYTRTISGDTYHKWGVTVGAWMTSESSFWAEVTEPSPIGIIGIHMPCWECDDGVFHGHISVDHRLNGYCGMCRTGFSAFEILSELWSVFELINDVDDVPCLQTELGRDEE